MDNVLNELIPILEKIKHEFNQEGCIIDVKKVIDYNWVSLVIRLKGIWENYCFFTLQINCNNVESKIFIFN